MNYAKKRAVAPVIATLLMVAIAVVGGMLIFVFAQDFFSQSDMMAGPTIEQVQITGYDVRDTAVDTIKNHAGIACTVYSAQDSVLGANEVFAVYVRNLGAQDVIFSEVQVYGEIATAADAGALANDADGTGNPGVGEWTFSTGILNDACGATDASVALGLGAGQDGTILIGYDSTNWNGDVKVGRPIFIQIETGAGNTFSKQLINGRSS